MRNFILNIRVIKSRRNMMGSLVAHTGDTREAYKIFVEKIEGNKEFEGYGQR
jgi:hypothetical protein